MKPHRAMVRLVLICVLAGAASLPPAHAENLFPPELYADDLDGTNGFIIMAYGPDNQLGETAEGAPDVNGDGIEDLLLGAPGNVVKGGVSGRVHVIFGAPDLGATGWFDTRDLDGHTGFTFLGQRGSESTGTSLASGDFNADGFTDVVIGDPGAWDGNRGYVGQVYVIFGRPDFSAHAEIRPHDLDGDLGFVISGINPDDFLGTDVANAGDVNGDGIDDLIISALPRYTDTFERAGQIYVLFGGPDLGRSGRFDLTTLDGTNGFVMNGFQDRMALVLAAGAGDVNADGIDDFLVASVGADVDGIEDAGMVFIVFGAPDVGAGGSLDLRTLDGSNGFTIVGECTSQLLGQILTGNADINHDGVADFMVFSGIPECPPQIPAVAVILGHPAVGSGGVMRISDLDGTNGFVILASETGLGPGLSGAGDPNADGIADVLIGSAGPIPDALMLFGRPGIGASGVVDAGHLNGIDGVRLLPLSDDHGTTFGWGVALADLNADGVDDMVVGAPYFRRRGTASGEAYVFFGRSLRPFGDFDRDGDIDLADFNTFAACYRGAGVPVADECKIADLDGDTDADLTDFATFSAYFTGPR